MRSCDHAIMCACANVRVCSGGCVAMRALMCSRDHVLMCACVRVMRRSGAQVLRCAGAHVFRLVCHRMPACAHALMQRACACVAYLLRRCRCCARALCALAWAILSARWVLLCTLMCCRVLARPIVLCLCLVLHLGPYHALAGVTKTLCNGSSH